MKKILTALLSTLALTSAQASDKVWNVIVLADPGSGDHLMAMALEKVAVANGGKFNIQFQKGCRSIVSVLESAKEPTVAITPGPLYYPGQKDAECFFPDDTAKRLNFIGVMESSINFCSVPGKAFTRQDIASGRPIRVGVGTDSAPYLRKLVAAMGGADNVKIVPYRGTGDIVKASVAGDIDMSFGAAVIRRQPGINCIGASTKVNALKLPFLGDLTKNPTAFPEVSDAVALTSGKNNLTAAQVTQMRGWLNHPDFQAWREKSLVKAIDHDSDRVEQILRQWSQVLAK